MTFAPRTWVVGEVVTAALMNQEIRDQFNSMFAWTSYTPAIAGGGSATTSAAVGWYRDVGGRVDFTLDITIGTAGSGASLVTVTAPTSIYRGGRQQFACHGKGLFTSGMAADGCGVARETGSGAVIDEISISGDNALNRDSIVTGANLLGTCRFSMTGSYRKA